VKGARSYTSVRLEHQHVRRIVPRHQKPTTSASLKFGSGNSDSIYSRLPKTIETASKPPGLDSTVTWSLSDFQLQVNHKPEPRTGRVRRIVTPGSNNFDIRRVLTFPHSPRGDLGQPQQKHRTSALPVRKFVQCSSLYMKSKADALLYWSFPSNSSPNPRAHEEPYVRCNGYKALYYCSCRSKALVGNTEVFVVAEECRMDRKAYVIRTSLRSAVFEYCIASRNATPWIRMHVFRRSDPLFNTATLLAKSYVRCAYSLMKRWYSETPTGFNELEMEVHKCINRPSQYQCTLNRWARLRFSTLAKGIRGPSYTWKRCV